jgi:hypothetical protein
MVSADQVRISGMDVLLETCRKAAGYLNLGLEELAGGRLDAAEDLLKLHPLILIFQVGFSLTLELKWETERWMKQAWYGRMDFEGDFWGDEWGGTLEAILRKRPLHFSMKEGGVARPFESLLEVHRTGDGLRQVFAVDRLLGILHSRHPTTVAEDPLITFHQLLFTFWARKGLDLDPGFEPITLTHLKSILSRLRKGRKSPPFRMEEYSPVFIDDLLRYGGEELQAEEKERLRKTLSRLWDEFSEEYAGVALADVEGKFSRFILIRPETTGIPH